MVWLYRVFLLVQQHILCHTEEDKRILVWRGVFSAVVYSQPVTQNDDKQIKKTQNEQRHFPYRIDGPSLNHRDANCIQLHVQGTTEGHN